jgi:hypothetical protein
MDVGRVPLSLIDCKYRVDMLEIDPMVVGIDPGMHIKIYKYLFKRT